MGVTEGRVLASVLCLAAACTPTSSSTVVDAARSPAPEERSQADASNSTNVGLTLFDRVVSRDALFPEGERDLYQVMPAQEVQGKRVYAFLLKPQAGMDPSRHFHTVSIAVMPSAGALDGGSVRGLAGPNGSFNQLDARTADGRFDLLLSQGGLLPEQVMPPAFDLTRAAQELANRYAALAAGNK
jgi:hypothetical protein